MSDEEAGGVRRRFRIIGAFALVWNVLGAANFLWQMNADRLDAFRAVERAIIEGRPPWATAGFAIAVFGGALGGLLLLLRKSTACYQRPEYPATVTLDSPIKSASDVEKIVTPDLIGESITLSGYSSVFNGPRLGGRGDEGKETP